MSIVINFKGLQTPGGVEDRDIAYLDVEHNGTVYDWVIYVPQGVNLGEFLENSKPSIEADIVNKEQIWEALDPKTQTIPDPINPEQTIEVPIEKTSIVKAEFPDYYAKRRAEYPDFRIYLDAVAKNDQTQIQSYIDACNAVKMKYPKP